jgi:hypothetical protein
LDSGDLLGSLTEDGTDTFDAAGDTAEVFGVFDGAGERCLFLEVGD